MRGISGGAAASFGALLGLLLCIAVIGCGDDPAPPVADAASAAEVASADSQTATDTADTGAGTGDIGVASSSGADSVGEDASSAPDGVEGADSSPSLDASTGDSADAQVMPTDGGPADSNPPPGCGGDGDCAPFEDGNPCTGTYLCDKSGAWPICRLNPSSIVACATAGDTPCLQTSCDPADGMCKEQPAINGTPCIDNDACTVDSACDAGKCQQKGTASWCDCKATADCAALEDGDKCTGTLYCDAAHFPYKCKLIPTSVVKCAQNDDTTCIANLCNSDTGKCAMTPAPNGTPCDDGNANTVSDSCNAGQCAAGIVPPCAQNSDCDKQEDGKLCNGTLFCDKGTGKCLVNPNTIIACPTGGDTACRKNLCNDQTGQCAIQSVKNGSPCDDGDQCTAGDVCVAGACKPGDQFTCACKAHADCDSYDDGDKCNGVYFCNMATKGCQFNPASRVQCKTLGDTDCSKAACVPASGVCVPMAVGNIKDECDLPDDGCRRVVQPPGAASKTGIACDDGDKCTLGDVCTGAMCSPGVKSCPCQTHADCLAEDDGDLCNGVPLCDKSAGKCTEKQDFQKVFCSKLGDTDCVKNACRPTDGACVPAPANQGGGCDDGQPCTIATTCDKGACLHGKANPCDDEDPCTLDSCAKTSGCEHEKKCGDGKVCTVDACDPKTGACSFLSGPLDAKACDADGDGCTIGDICSAGECAVGSAIDCAQAGGAGGANACLSAKCLSTGPFSHQCVPQPAADGTACDDGDVCKLGASCQAGKCEKGSDDKLFARSIGADPAAGKVMHFALTDVVQAASADGSAAGFVACGATWQGNAVPADEKDAPVSLSWAVTRVDAAGRKLWSAEIDTPVGDYEATARGMMLLDDGSVVVVGAIRPQKNTGLDAQLAVVSASGKDVPLKKAYGEKGVVDDVLSAVAVQSESAWLAVGHKVDADKKHKAWLLRVSDLGKELDSWTWIGLYEARAAGLLVDLGGAVLVGDSNKKGARRQGWLMRLDKQGKPAWQRHYDQADADGQVLVAVAADTDGFVLSGWRQEGAARRSLVLKVDADGLLVDEGGAAVGWQRASSGNDLALAVAALGTDKLVATYLAVGRTGKTDDAADLFIRAIDGHGYVVADRAIDLGANEQLAAVKGVSDGGLVAVGRAQAPGGTMRAVLVRFTPWGHTSCASAGGCAKLGAPGCDDDNACTDDFCTAKTGCAHSNNVNPCDDGDACTEKERCKAATCKISTPIDCDDGNVCTKDECDSGSKAKLGKGCFYGPGATFCSDGDACTDGDKCLELACKADKKVCDDGNFCTKDGCDSAAGCVYTKSDEGCDDGNECTVDACKDGSKQDKAGACGYDTQTNNAKPCEDGDTCTVGEACAGGKCAGGGGKLFVRPYGWDGPEYFYAVARLPDGSFVAAGKEGTSKLGPSAYLVQTSALGGSLGSSLAPHLKSNEKSEFHAVTAADDAYGGGFLAAGQAFGTSAYFIRYKTPGATLWYKWFTADGTPLSANAVVPAPGGYLWAGAANYGGATGWRAQLGRLTPGGGAVWRKDIGGPGTQASRLARLQDGTFLVLGTASSGGGDATVTHVNAFGESIWARTLGGAAYDILHDVVPAQGDGSVGVGETGSQGVPAGGSRAAWVVRMDGSGRPIWQRTMARGLWHAWVGANVRDDGSVMLAGNSYSGGGVNYPIELAEIGPRGALRWQRTHSGGAGDNLRAAIGLPDGGMILAGRTGSYAAKAGGDALLMRVDRWGFGSCAGAGKCSQVPYGGCSDSDPCTDDLCEPTKGCVNQNNAADCDDGNPCTLSGSCKDGSCGTGAARYWDVTIGDKLEQRGVSVVLHADGTMTAVGTKQVPANKNGLHTVAAVLHRVNEAGTVVASEQHVLGSEDGMKAIGGHPFGDGGILLIAGSGRHYLSKTPESVHDYGRPATGLFIDSAGQITKSVDMGSVGPDPIGNAGTFVRSDGAAFVVSSFNGVHGDRQSVFMAAVSPSGSSFVTCYPYASLSRATHLVDSHIDKGGLLAKDVIAHGGAEFGPTSIGVVGTATVQGRPDRQAFIVSYHMRDQHCPDSGHSSSWVRWYGGAGDDGFRAVMVDRDASRVAVGATRSFGGGGSDGWLVQTVGRGLVQRRQTVGGSEDEELIGVVRRTPADLVAWGWTTSAPAAERDGWVVAVDNDIKLLWTRTYGGKKDDDLVDVKVLEGGELALLGNTRSKGAGGQDIWLIRADPWGRFACADIGACAKETASTCDDHDPCTVDLCDQTKGCTHTPSPTACVELASCPKAEKWADPPLQQREQLDALFGKPAASDAAAAVLDLGDGRVQAAGHRWEQTGKLRDGWMVQTSAAGEVIWERAWGGAKDDRFESMVGHPAGGVIGAGASASPELGNAGGEDGWIVQVADDGTMLWTRTYGGTEDDSLWGLAVRRDGGSIAVGRTNTASNGAFDGWVVRTDPHGAVIWQRALGGKGLDYFYAVTTSGADSVAAGTTKSAAPAGTDKAYADKGGFDLWLVRLDGAGKTLWDRRFGTAKDDTGRAIVANADGGFAIAGSSLGFGFGDAMLWRFDKEGDVVWQRNFGGPNLVDAAHALARLPLGGFALAGGTASKGAGKEDGWIVVTGEDGTQRWDRTIGTSVDERFTAIAPLRHGGFALAGSREKPDSEAWVLRTNPWGYSDCKAAGKCAHNGPDLCDDGVACTFDACDPTKGCTHTLIPGAGDCPPRNDKTKPGLSCAHVRKADPGAKSGSYWIDPKGDWTSGAVLVGCDMVTDGGGWTLALALPNDTSRDWKLHLYAADGVATESLATAVAGDVNTAAALPKALLNAVAAYGGVEALSDIGSGLVRLRLQPADSKAGSLDLFEAIHNPTHAQPFVHSVHVAAGLRTPTTKVPWAPSGGDMRTGVKCGELPCAYLPADAGGPWRQLHRTTGTPAAGYDGRAPRYSKLFVRSCTTSCEDGDICTTDACTWPGGCTNTPRDCDDGNPCTVDACDKQKGCTHAHAKDTTACLPAGCEVGACSAGKCLAKPGLLPTCGKPETPAPSCAVIKQASPTAANGKYTLDFDGPYGPEKPQIVHCMLTVKGADPGGWTLASRSVVDKIPTGADKEYLMVSTYQDSWARSPITKKVFSWEAGQEVTGVWTYHDQSNKPQTWSCPGSAEKPAYGIGCSSGHGYKWKVSPTTPRDGGLNGEGSVAEDPPNYLEARGPNYCGHYVRWRYDDPCKAPGATGKPCAADGDPCTLDICDASHTCIHDPKPLLDKACTGDGNPCTANVCRAAKGCTAEPVKDETVCSISGCAPGKCAAGQCKAATGEPLPAGCSSDNPGVSCAALKKADATLKDGAYWLDADGAGAIKPFRVWCDMTADGGGWTLVGKVRGDTLTEDNGILDGVDAARWKDKKYLGTIADLQLENALGPSYDSVAFSDFMLQGLNDKTKKLAWRHGKTFTSLFAVLGAGKTEKSAKLLVGDFRTMDWRPGCGKGSGPDATGPQYYGFNIAGDTASDGGKLFNGFQGGWCSTLAGWGRANNADGYSGGGLGTHCWQGRTHQLGRHRWGYGDGCDSADWGGPRESQSLHGHAFFVR